MNSFRYYSSISIKCIIWSCMLRIVEFTFLNLCITKCWDFFIQLLHYKRQKEMIFNAFFFNHHSFSTHFHSFCSPQVYFYNDFFHNSSFCLFLSSKEIRYHFVLIPTVSFCYFHSMLLLLLYHSLNDSSFKHVT